MDFRAIFGLATVLVPVLIFIVIGLATDMSVMELLTGVFLEFVISWFSYDSWSMGLIFLAGFIGAFVLSIFGILYMIYAKWRDRRMWSGMGEN